MEVGLLGQGSRSTQNAARRHIHMPDPATTEATVSSLGQFPHEAIQTKLVTASGLEPVPIQSSKEGSLPRN